MNTESRTSPNLDQIRDQQRETWDKFSAGWKKWDAMVLGWIAPFGEAMILALFTITLGTPKPVLAALSK